MTNWRLNAPFPPLVHASAKCYNAAMRQVGDDRSFPFAEGGESTIAVATGILAGAAWAWGRWRNSGMSLLFALVSAAYMVILYFFRDPYRPLPQADKMIFSPGDGEVVTIVEEREERFLAAETIRISIFLSIFDVHIQRTPIAGTVTNITHQPGKFLQAFRPEASEVNEFIAMTLDTAHGAILVKQIAGIVARRCVNYAHVGDQLQAGQRFGLIRFSSRVDLFLPATAEMLVQVGDKVNAGVSPIAQFV